MHAFHADINKCLSIVSAPSSMMGDALRKDSTMYVGAYEFCSNSSDKYFFANGYIDIEQGHVKAYCYYANDHLGNVRHVDRAGLDNRGNEIVQVSNYYSYGGVHTDVDNGVDVQNHLYNGKELDRMHGLNLYDYSARQYDAALGQFTSMDPLCEKYYHISPYAYCAGNPVKYVDPDGNKLVIYYDKNKAYTYTDGGKNAAVPNNRFVKQVMQAYQYNKNNWLKAYGTSDGSPSIEAASDVNRMFVIHEGLEQSYGGGGVSWNPDLGLVTALGVVLSPATGLDHELDHALQAQKQNKKYVEDKGNPDKSYDNHEEKRVIEGSEQKTAYANGEIKKGQVTRTDHNKGTSKIVKGGVTSTIIDNKRTIEYEKRKNSWSSGN